MFLREHIRTDDTPVMKLQNTYFSFISAPRVGAFIGTYRQAQYSFFEIQTQPCFPTVNIPVSIMIRSQRLSKRLQNIVLD